MKLSSPAEIVRLVVTHRTLIGWLATPLVRAQPVKSVFVLACLAAPSISFSTHAKCRSPNHYPSAFLFAGTHPGSETVLIKRLAPVFIEWGQSIKDDASCVPFPFETLDSAAQLIEQSDPVADADEDFRNGRIGLIEPWQRGVGSAYRGSPFACRRKMGIVLTVGMGHVLFPAMRSFQVALDLYIPKYNERKTKVFRKTQPSDPCGKIPADAERR